MKLIVAVVVLSCVACSYAKWNDFMTQNCCEPHDDEHLGRICDDGSRAPLVGCCGVGDCNVMCCNCDNGCKTGYHKPHKMMGVWGAEISPNIGYSGASNPVPGDQFISKGIITGVSEAGKGTYDFGSGVAAGNQGGDPDIEYHPAKK